ncbi:MAG TPA: hypothetical protein DER19_05940 [Eubacterium sp.]|nr:hypothetical protein [Eubacterium sp.]
MKILHITATHLKPDGGVPIVLKKLVIEQNKIDNIKSTVISLVADVDDMQCVFFKHVPIRNFNDFIVRYNPDIAILHSFYYYQYNFIVKSLIGMKIPYFIEPHGSFGRAALKKSYLKKVVANNTVFRKQIKKAYGFIFLNNAEKKDSKYKTCNDLVIPNGLDSSDISNEIKENQDFRLYYIGRYDVHHKGMDYLMKALEILDKEKYSLEVVMWGKGAEKDEQYLIKKQQSFKYVNLCIKPSIYGEEKKQQLEQIGPMILTSRYEGFPMTVLEAWGFGNPCIVTEGTNVADEVVNNGLGWRTRLDAKSIANCIKVAVEDYSVNKKEYIFNTKKYVLDNYGWEKIAQRSIRLLNKKE